MASLMLTGVMTLGLFAGCSKDASQSSTSGGSKDSIVIATMSETPSLSPTDHNAVAGSYMNILTYNTLFRGDMDLKPVPELVEVEAMDAERIESNSDLTLLQHDSTNHMWMMLNNEKPGLDNVDVRRAINSVVNKENIVTVALNGMGVASYS